MRGWGTGERGQWCNPGLSVGDGVYGRAPAPTARPQQGRGSGDPRQPPLLPELISSLSPSVFLANSLPLKFKCCCSPFLTLCRNISLFI